MEINSSQVPEIILDSNQRIVYKLVVSRPTGRYFSLNHLRSNLTNLEYKMNEWTEPRLAKSKLFVFNSLEDAYAEIRPYTFGVVIMKCVAENCCEAIPLIPSWGGDLSEFWNDWTYIRTGMKQWPTPTGTLFADKVKLICKCGSTP